MIGLLKIILSLSLSGSLVILILLLCKPFIKNRLSKRWQYYIWLIVIARLLLPIAPQINLMGTLFQHLDSTVIQTYENLSSQQNSPKLPEWDFVHRDKTVEATDGDSLESDNPPPNMSNMAAQNIGAVCLMVWLIATVALFVRKVTIYQSFVKYIKAGRFEISDLGLWERTGKLTEQTGIKRAVGLYTNSLISSPMLVGFFRPCIMLPTTQLPDSDFQYTILHELTHYKRGDMFYKWLVQFTVCLHWFNPLVYLMSREVSCTCELACDEAVIGKLDSGGRQAYGETLLNALGAGGSYKDAVASVTLSEGKERLTERLDAIMNFKKKTQMTAVFSVTLAMVLCFSATAAGAYAAAPQAGQYEKAASDSPVISLASNGKGQITQSGSFESEENQVLILTAQSDIQGGAVDLFLFSPDGKEQRFTFTGSDKTEMAALFAGRWNYNCTGFFTGGDISISGELKHDDGGSVGKKAETASQLPDYSDEKAIYDPSVISLASNGKGQITQSGNFEAGENQVLILTAQSDIQGGAVDLFLFSPDGKEQRFTFTGSDKTEMAALFAGRWNYNCTGFFTGGDISISGELKHDEKSSDSQKVEVSPESEDIK